MKGLAMNRPEVVPAEEWQAARDELLVKEKAHTRAGDALAAERRRLPMTPIEKRYEFDGPDGKVSLAGLFEGRTQLALYNFMLAPGGDPCPGCSVFTDQLGHIEHANGRDLTIALVSRAPLDEIQAVKDRMGWNAIPWYSSGGTDWNQDHGFTTDRGEMFGLTMLLRDGEDVFRTYFTDRRGVEGLSSLGLVDAAPYGRQEEWEDSPEGWPQAPTYTLGAFHDSYPPEPQAPSYHERVTT
jgi:predicted dithiol-disulfide oxidoreductase (DUF899 family)